MILVTGCAGFIGYHLSIKLLKKNIKVIGIDSLNDYYSKKLKLKRLSILKKNSNFYFSKIDLNNYSSLNLFLKKKKIDKIIHLAAQPGVRVSLKKPFNTLKQNINAFINILEIARVKKIKKILYASSSSIYGETKIYPFNEDDKVELWMLCDNPFYTEDENFKWERLYRTSKLGDKIKIIPRQQMQEDVYNIMMQADCGVFPARAEGWNLDLLEMMSCGKQTIATNYSAHTEFCNEDNCMLVETTEMVDAEDGKWFRGFVF